MLESLTADWLKKFKLEAVVFLRAFDTSLEAGGTWPLDATNLTNRPVAFYFKDYGAKFIAAMWQDMGVQKWTSPRAFLFPSSFHLSSRISFFRLLKA